MSSTPHIVIFGASGKVGRLLVDYALADGYHVVAFAHRHHDLPNHSHLQIAKGDIYNAADVEKVIQDADVVLSALGSWGTPKKDVLSAAMKNIIPAMQRRGITRIISLTGADARASGDKLSLIHRLSHLAIRIIAGKILSDGERHIELLERSELDWTVIRSPIMRSSTSQRYHFSKNRPLPWATISRSSVAQAMVDQIGDERFLQRSLFVR